MNVAQIIASLGLDSKELEKGLRRAEAQADKAASKIGTIFKNAFSVTVGMVMFEALKKGFKSTVGTAISFNSMLQTAQIGFATMLGSAEKAQAFLDDMADFAAKTPFGYEELLEASKKMLAYGFAAENVLPTLRAVGDAAAALGMSGEGIDRITLALGQILAKGKLSAEEMRQLTEAGIPAWHMLAEAMGTTVPELQKMVSKGLVPGAKAVEMLTAGMEKRFGGMMASMENTWQGVTSSIKDIWSMTVGTLTQTLFGGLNNMLIQVRDFMAAFYSYLQGILGKKVKQSTDALVGSTKAQAAAITEVGDASEEAAKKANKNLQTFDEVHQLQEEMSDTAAGDMFAMPETGAMAPLEMEDAGEPEALTKIQEVFEKLAVLFDPAIEGFNRLKTAAEPVIANIGEGLRWFYDNILVPFGTWVIAEAIPAFFDLLAGVLSVLNPILEAFAPLGRWLWEEFLKPAAEWTGQAIVDGINWLADALTRVGDWISEHSGLVETFAIIVGSFAAAWGLVNIAIGIWNVIGAIATGVTTAFGAAVAFLTSPIGLVVLAIGAVIAIVALLIRHWDDVKAAAGAAWDWIKEKWQKASDWFDEHVRQPLEDIWNNIWGIIKGVLNKIIDGLNWVIRGLNKLQIKIPDWFKYIPGLSALAGKTWGFNIDEIAKIDENPKLARGGIVTDPTLAMTGARGLAKGGLVTAPTLAMLGEAGPEAVVPLGRSGFAGDLADTVAQAVYQAIMDAIRISRASSPQSSDEKEIVLKIDNTVLARMQLPALTREAQRQGFDLVLRPQGV